MSEIKIEDLTRLRDIENDNIIIVEDKEDTKKSTILDLKKSLNGDSKEPSYTEFYSSKTVQNLLSNVAVNSEAVYSAIANFDEKLNNITKVDGSSNSEVVSARYSSLSGSANSLSSRLSADNNEILTRLEEKISNPVTVLNSNTIEELVKYNTGKIQYQLQMTNTTSYGDQVQLYCMGKNLFSKTSYVDDTGISCTNNNNLLRITPTTNNNKFKFKVGFAKNNINGGFDIHAKDIVEPLPIDSYYIGISCRYEYVSGSAQYTSPTVGIPGMTILVEYVDGSTVEVEASTSYRNLFEIPKTSKAIQYISLVFSSEAVANIKICEFAGIQLAPMFALTDRNDSYSTGKVIAFIESINVQSGNQTILSTPKASKYSKDYIKLYITDTRGSLKVMVTDSEFTGDKITSDINNAIELATGDKDFCGLINKDKPGDYYKLPEYNPTAIKNCAIRSDNNHYRNGIDSTQTVLVFSTGEKSKIAFYPIIDISNTEYISIQLYIDRTIFEHFSENSGLTLYLSSDGKSESIVNSYSISLGSNRFVQGWNTIKIKKSEFTQKGYPDSKNINRVQIEIDTTDTMSGKSIWINSIILDQMIKPTVLLAFDFGFGDINDEAYSDMFGFQYPYLYSRDIPATVFLNSKQDIPSSDMDKLAQLQFEYGWDIGAYGCAPDKDKLIRDDNARDQYKSLKVTREYISANFHDNVISYAAPYGNLRPVTVPILKDLGFKIAKAASDSYCSFFGKDDMVLPMCIMNSETTIENIRDKIKYAIDTGQALCLYTERATQYGDEISVKSSVYKKIVEYIQSRVADGSLQCLTFADFYNKCVK